MCLLVGGFLLFGGWPSGPVDRGLPDAEARVVSTGIPSRSPYITANIEDLRAGDWVLAENPELSEAEHLEAADVDPATWRTIRLRMQKADGGRLDITLLRPVEWLTDAAGSTGKMPVAPERLTGSTIHLELAELGAEGPAEVTSVEPCPAIGPPPSAGCRLITGTFAHSAGNVLDLSIDGLSEPIGCTANHPFWSETRQTFVQAGDLHPGETLRTAAGELREVASILPRPGAQPVYNLEVDTEHVYYVSTDGVLVHNEYIRVRHYTSRSGLKSILKSNKLVPGDRNRVFAESARRKVLSAADAQKRYGLKKHKAKAYVETDVETSRVTEVKNPLTGHHELEISGGDVPLIDPKSVSRK